MTLDRNASLGIIGSILFLICSQPTAVAAERIFFAGYNGGFYIRSEEEGGMALRLGGTFETDYRHYLEDQRADNRFDVRRARLIFRGDLTRWFRFGMAYEFQGNETDNLVDAWAEAICQNHGLRFGQFKQPFSFEWQSSNKAQLFAERSMGYNLGPHRDVGLMLRGSPLSGHLHYSVGLFNGDGDDGDSRGSQHDEPEISGRLALLPFASSNSARLRGVQFGGSGTFAQIDTLNVNLRVKSTGMWAAGRNLYELSHNSKFGVLTDTGERLRYGIEAIWALGPVLMAAEYIKLTYTDLKVSGEPARDADFMTAYASLAWCATGEHFFLKQGALRPIDPDRYFSPADGTWGALVLALRYDRFRGDKKWINPAAQISVEQADAISLALNWVLFPMVRVIADATLTQFSDRIRVRVRPDGAVDTIDEENVFTLRFCMDF
jgi:phosphate-selective porin OprO/OprP